MKDLRELALDGIIYKKAYDVGIYPASIEGGPMEYKERDAYKKGWNDADLKGIDNVMLIRGFIESLSPDNKKYLEELLLEDVVDFFIEDGKVLAYINMSDTFAWGCADAEDVPVEKLESVYDLYKQFGQDGLTAWVADCRNMEPLKYWQRDKYKEAMKLIKERK
ncbi:MAG: hypothetical protein WC523_03860 [Patescibacteria group bacterium]